jgi:capsular polysaccharide biosynthesis protein/Mrp family chromosome partitioning ATPase
MVGDRTITASSAIGALVPVVPKAVRHRNRLKDAPMAMRQPKEQDDFANEPRSVDLRDYWLIIRRRWRMIVVLALIGAIGGAAYSVVRGPSYSATAQVVVQPVTQAPLNQTTQATSQVNMSTEQAIAQSGPVIQRAARTLKVSASTLQSAAVNRLSVTVPASTLTTSNVLQIAWQANSKTAARAGANAFANAYLSYRHQELATQISALQQTLQQQVSSLRSQIGQLSDQLAQSSSDSTRQVLNIRLNELSGQLNTTDTELAALPTYNDAGGSVIPAVINGKSSGFGRSVLVAIGLILGMLIGLVIAFARDLSDDRVRDTVQLERQLGAPTLAVMPSADLTDRRARSGLAAAGGVATDPGGYAAAAARVLRATVVALWSRRDLRTMMVVAADATTSASLIAAELGLALAESGRRVLLVASDTKGSALPAIFGLTGQPGLIELLARDGHLDAYTHPARQVFGSTLPTAVTDRLTVLPSGRHPDQPVSALHADRIASVLRTRREAFDFVLLDAPSEAGADILALASQVEGVIVLARQGRTRGKNLLALRHQLRQVGASLIGGVLISKARRPGRSASPPVTPPADRQPGPAPRAPRVPTPSPDPTPSAPSSQAASAPAPRLTPPAPPTLPLPQASAGDDLASPVAGGGGPERPQ